MSQELTPEQRLTQIEKILQSAIKLSHRTDAKIDKLTEKVEANSEAIKLDKGFHQVESFPPVALITENYSTGVKLTKKEMLAIENPIQRSPELGKWLIDIYYNSV